MKKDHKVEKVIRYEKEVYEDTTMDILRRVYCLCLNCAHLEPCEISTKFFELCKENGIALAVTRCPNWKRQCKS